VFGLVIWRLFLLIPRPEGADPGSVLDVITSDPRAIVGVVIGTVVVIVYWTQNNMLFGHLERTDGRHTALSIIQLFCLLVFLYAVGIGVQYESEADTRIFESVTAMLVGVPAYLGWRHAKRKGKLISPHLSKDDADAISVGILAEPITAAVTIPFAIFTPILWEASWFTYPLIARLLKARTEQL
jgi:uncharacterized membrane protein